MSKSAHAPHVGEHLKVTDIVGDKLLQNRLQEMGFFKGAEIHIVGKAPLGGPLLVEIGATTIALRDEELKCLITSKI